MYLPKHWNYWETFTPWFFLILMAIMFLGCGNPDDRFKPFSRDDCFRLGGTRYEAGESNGNTHSVCIYERK